MNRVKLVAAVLACCPLAVGCVSKATYDEAARSADHVRAGLTRKLQEDETAIDRLRARLAAEEVGRASMQKSLDEEEAAGDRLARESTAWEATREPFARRTAS